MVGQHDWRRPDRDQITLPAGVTLNFAGQTNEGGDAAGLTFDPSTKQLYLTNADNDTTVRDKGAIYQLQYIPASHSVTLVNTCDTAQLVGATPATVDQFDAPSATTFDNLPVLTVTGTSTAATEQGLAATLANSLTITDIDGDHLAGATVQITGGTFPRRRRRTNRAPPTIVCPSTASPTVPSAEPISRSAMTARPIFDAHRLRHHHELSDRSQRGRIRHDGQQPDQLRQRRDAHHRMDSERRRARYSRWRAKRGPPRWPSSASTTRRR